MLNSNKCTFHDHLFLASFNDFWAVEAEERCKKGCAVIFVHVEVQRWYSQRLNEV